MEKTDDIVDVEQCALNGLHIPKNKRYRIRIDRERYIVNAECLLGRELLRIAGKNPVEKFLLNQKFKDGRIERIGLDEEVCFTTPGVERFMTLPTDQTDGE